MKPILLLLAFPAFLVAGQISGTVSDLNGVPISGVVVSSNVESDVSKPSGSWILGRSAKVAGKTGSAVRVSSNLIIENGRPKLSWKGFSLDGRKMSAAGPHAGSEFASRATGASASPETLWVYWKGKRLAQVPIESTDTSGVAIRIDTAWKHDFGIPWNPKIKYGSLLDERDGQVYRTVQIGDHTWMAENLNYKGKFGVFDTVGRCYGDDSSLCMKFGRFYRWGHAIAGTRGFGADLAYTETVVQGVCPAGWRAPREKDWEVLLSSFGVKIWRQYTFDADERKVYFNGDKGFCDSTKFFCDSTMVHYGSSLQQWEHEGDSQLAARLLAPRGGSASMDASDSFGFRILLSGICRGDNPCEDFDKVDEIGRFWSSNNPGVYGPGSPDPGSVFWLKASGVGVNSQEAGYWNSIRCLK